MESYRFQTLRSALALVKFCNPARAKSVNVLEDNGSNPTESDSLERELLFTSVFGALADAKRGHPKRTQQCFEAYHLGVVHAYRDRTGMIVTGRKYLGFEDLAQWYGVSTRSVRNWVRAIENDFEDELIRRELLPPRDRHLN